MKKLDGYDADLIKEIIRESDSAFEIDGKKYQVISLEDQITTIEEDIKVDPELEQKLYQAKKDISANRVYTTDEVLKMIDQGEL